MRSPPVFWDGVLRRLQAEVPAHVIEAWVRPLSVETLDDRIRLLCPSALHRERIRKRYLSHIAKHIIAEAGKPVSIEVDLAPVDLKPEFARSKAPVEKSAAGNVQPPSPRRTARQPAAPKQQELPHTFENFVVGSCNRLAREASLAVAQGKQQSINPLYLTSAPGFGKTHLVRAIVETRKLQESRVIYASAESFTNQFTDAIRHKRMDRFKHQYRRSCDVLVVEDVQFLSSKKATQLELFHTLSHLLGVGARVVLTGDRLPREISALDERLGSHMTAGLVATLEPPNSMVRREILRSKAARGGVKLPEDCLDLLVDVVRGSVRDLEGVLVQLVTSSSLLKRPIDLQLTEQALQKVAAVLQPTKCLELRTIIQAVAAFYRTTPAALAARSRRRDVVIPRQLAMYLCRRYTRQPVTAIASAFARKHPSVRNAEKAVEQKMLENAPFRYKVEAIAARLDDLERQPR